MKSYFPDINVWIALTCRIHRHHTAAKLWFEQLLDSTAVFCRMTQVGFLRLLTHSAVMQEEVKSQIEAWKAYDLLMASARVGFIQEADSDALEEEFRTVTMTENFAHKQWPDAYLAAFAKTSNLTLVTFDNALYKLAGDDAILLQGRTQ